MNKLLESLRQSRQRKHGANESAEYEIAKLRRELEQLVSDRLAHEEWNQSLLEAVAEGIITTTKDGLILSRNRAAADMFGLPQESDSREYIDQLLPKGITNAPFRKFISNNIMKFPIAMLEGTGRRTDGSWFPLELSISALQQTERRIYIVIVRDISARVEAETHRKKMEIQLRQAQKLESIGQLAAGIAHEINTPTQFVSDNTYFLKESLGDLLKLCDLQARALEELSPRDKTSSSRSADKIAAFASEIAFTQLKTDIPLAIEQSLDGLQRITRIVRAMKDFSHPGTDKKTLVNINKALASTIDVSRNEWKYHAELVTDFDPALPLLNCLPGELNQAFLNIIVNAAHAIADAVRGQPEKKGVITVTTRGSDSMVEITIGDTGNGIPEDILPRIFDPFFTTKEVGKGTGQGLAIAYSAIVDKHGGTINVTTNQGQGTIFHINLPIEQQEK